jgi:hypothetical protein
MWNYLSGVKYEMENEKDLSDSEIESDLEEDIKRLKIKKKFRNCLDLILCFGTFKYINDIL